MTQLPTFNIVDNIKCFITICHQMTIYLCKMISNQIKQKQLENDSRKWKCRPFSTFIVARTFKLLSFNIITVYLFAVKVYLQCNKCVHIVRHSIKQKFLSFSLPYQYFFVRLCTCYLKLLRKANKFACLI